VSVTEFGRPTLGIACAEIAGFEMMHHPETGVLEKLGRFVNDELVKRDSNIPLGPFEQSG
jgi:hypothetical protein